MLIGTATKDAAARAQLEWNSSRNRSAIFCSTSATLMATSRLTNEARLRAAYDKTREQRLPPCHVKITATIQSRQPPSQYNTRVQLRPRLGRLYLASAGR